jgi:hypothetical protein
MPRTGCVMLGVLGHLQGVINTMLRYRIDGEKTDLSALRCDACGEPVTDMATHVAACLEHELRMFAVGRRSN